jgi:hypothetical protein
MPEPTVFRRRPNIAADLSHIARTEAFAIAGTLRPGAGID